MIVAVLAACTGPKGASTPTGSGTGTPTSAASPSLVSQLPEAKSGVGELTWDLPHGEPSTIDPAQAVDYSPDFVVSNLCDPLLRQNSDFSISPNLATARQVDPTTLELTLRSGVTFWDGTPLTSADAVYSLTRIWKNPNYPTNFLFGFVKTITAPDSHTVKITFTKPDELFVKELSSPMGMVVEKAFTEKAGGKFGTAQRGVMCSGPFKFESWKPGNSITLAKNTAYWNADATAKAQTVKISFVTDSAAITQGLLSGEFDGAYELPASVVPALKGNSAGTLTFGPSPQSLVFGPTHPGGIVANPDLRKALWTGVNREQIAKAAYNGAAQPNYTDLAKTAWDPDGTSVYAAAYQQWVTENAYNPIAAKSLVQRSGYSGETLNLGILSGDTTQSTVAQVIQQQLSQIGIKIAIKPLQAIQYSNASYQASARKGLDLMLAYNFNQVADPLEFMGLVMQPGGVYNYTNFDGKQAVALLDRARGTFDATARARLVVQAQNLYEPVRADTSLVNANEISFLNSKLTGATTSFAYMFRPSLAYIGGK